MKRGLSLSLSPPHMFECVFYYMKNMSPFLHLLDSNHLQTRWHGYPSFPFCTLIPNQTSPWKPKLPFLHSNPQSNLPMETIATHLLQHCQTIQTHPPFHHHQGCSHRGGPHQRSSDGIHPTRTRPQHLISNLHAEAPIFAHRRRCHHEGRTESIEIVRKEQCLALGTRLRVFPAGRGGSEHGMNRHHNLRKLHQTEASSPLKPKASICSRYPNANYIDPPSASSTTGGMNWGETGCNLGGETMSMKQETSVDFVPTGNVSLNAHVFMGSSG
uniref:Uncharacterized protein n=1 Tax=Lactuca sativa TaxID=4236 RepID=A0A9R1UDF8_LACSA|nr:hypothetical protein LSAT_V11C900493380 [Lactuca sativa]